jgi:hypothetical protein
MPGKGKSRKFHFAFVLLSEAWLPDAQEIARAFADFAAPGLHLQPAGDEEMKAARDEVVSLKLNTGETCCVALMPGAIPNGEADNHVEYSLSSFRNQWKLPAHCAKLVVSLQLSVETLPVEQLSRFTSILAAVTRSSPSVGVYWGNARATHDSGFFVSVASRQGVVPRIMLWSGVSIARQSDGRLSLLSLGMEQLNLPDILLLVGTTSAQDACEALFDMLAYVARWGGALPEGHTIGRTADERLPVRYVPSPADRGKRVLRVELP